MSRYSKYIYLYTANGRARAAERGSVLIIVMVICLGLVALTLYFANSMSSELRAADNSALSVSARQAAAGGMRYAAYLLTTYGLSGAVPDPTTQYQPDTLQVGDGTFWFIGRDPNNIPTTQPVFGLVDEASKLNLNTATPAMLMALPGMTTDLAQAIIDWRGPNAANRLAAGTTVSTAGTGSTADSTYAAFDPPRLNKNAPFETADELRLVNGATLDLVLGEDTNRNGALDPNEDDSDQSPPHDNQDGVLQPGFLEYITVYSRQPNTRTSGAARIDIRTPASRTALAALLTRRTNAGRSAIIMNNIGSNNFNSVAEFMVASQMTATEFAQIHTDITASTGRYVPGLVNVNTASATVLSCIPGIGPNNAAAIVAYRLANVGTPLTSFGWLPQVMSRADIIRAGPYITDQSYQFTADVAAVGRLGRGYCRERTVFETTSGTPRIIYHQDLSQYGWALGSQVRQNLKQPSST